MPEHEEGTLGRTAGDHRGSGDRRQGVDRRQAQAHLPVAEERRIGRDRRTLRERRFGEGSRHESDPPPLMPAFRNYLETAPRGSAAIAAYPEDFPRAPRLRQIARLELPEADAERHWRAIARHRENLLRTVGRDVGLRVAVLDYFLNIRPQLVDLAIIESGALEAIERSAIVDSLTGVFNREYFNAALVRELERCRRHKVSSSLLMLDVDNLKTLNDHLGHEAGDEALRRLGSLVRKALRAVDVPCRYGGDEFAILLPDTDQRKALAVAERIRSDVGPSFREHPMGGRLAQLTISGGLAACTGDAGSAESVMVAADAALYVAKRAGGNRIASGPDWAGPKPA